MTPSPIAIVGAVLPATRGLAAKSILNLGVGSLCGSFDATGRASAAVGASSSSASNVTSIGSGASADRPSSENDPLRDEDAIEPSIVGAGKVTSGGINIPSLNLR